MCVVVFSPQSRCHFGMVLVPAGAVWRVCWAVAALEGFLLSGAGWLGADPQESSRVGQVMLSRQVQSVPAGS